MNCQCFPTLLLFDIFISLTTTYPDGGKYVGEFKYGKKNGQGTYTHYDGSKYVGEFKDDKRWNGTRYDKNGNIQYKIVNGKRVIQ